jgi:integrase
VHQDDKDFHEELERLVAAAASPLERTLILTGALAGLRVSELCKLRVVDVDLAQRLIFVQLAATTNRSCFLS